MREYDVRFAIRKLNTEKAWLGTIPSAGLNIPHFSTIPSLTQSEERQNLNPFSTKSDLAKFR